MFKNITISQIALILAIFVGGLNVLTYLLLLKGGVGLLDNFGSWLLLTVVNLGLAYLVLRFVLDKFIFRKIKLIYKIINSSKRREDKPLATNVDDKTIDNVREEVEQWAKTTEDEIQYLTKLEDYRRNYLGNISHELKTPIFTIQGYLHTLIDGGLYDEQINMKYLRRAISNVERLENIVEDLEIINKLESGGVVFDIQSFDMKELAEEVMSDLSILGEEKDISITFKDGASKAFEVDADRETIRQVLTNLISNSIKYGKEGGETRIAFYDMADKVLIEISDDGIGIEEHHLKHLFDRFYRVDASRSRQQGGSGLGLAIVKHILEAHHQNINVRSTLDVGSTFGFTLKKNS